MVWLSLCLALLAPTPQAGRPPAAVDGFTVQLDGPAGPAAGSRLAGFTGSRNSPRLAQAFDDAGAGAGIYRRTVFLNNPGATSAIDEDFLLAHGQGQRVWLTVVGTPRLLSPHPDQTNNTFDTGLPEYARYPPTDPLAWADATLDFLQQLESSTGLQPDYLEIWNEPDRPEWYTGTAQEFLRFYLAAAPHIKAARPGLRIGGPGLAGVRSSLNLGRSFLELLLLASSTFGAPIDFLSWHHYAPANELHATGAVARLKALAAASGLGAMPCFVSEWNIGPSAQGPLGPLFDRAPAAANFAGFITSAYELGLDGNLYFMDMDEADEAFITDLLGLGIGALTHHGIKKPVFRAAEFLFGMAGEDLLPVIPPSREESLRVLVSRSGNRVRVAASNDAIESMWVFVQRAEENGMSPGWLYPRWIAAGDRAATLASLQYQGLSYEQAVAVLAFMPEVFDAERYQTESRTLSLFLPGNATFTLGEAWRFDATHHAPAENLNALKPWIELVAKESLRASLEACALYLTNAGYPYTWQDILPIQSDFIPWATQQGIPYGIAVLALKIMRDTLRDERLARIADINSRPEAALTPENAAAAGVRVGRRKLTVDLPPNSMIIFDITL